MTGLEHKFAGADLTLDEGFVVSGYASLFGRQDDGGDVVEPGAYRASLDRMSARGGAVKMLWQHDPAQPIGIWDEVREDATGLWVKGRLLREVARAAEAAALVAAGAIDGLSVGYRTIRASKAPTGGRRLAEIDLWEVSLVTFPMLKEARVAAKSDPEGPDLAPLERAMGAARAAYSKIPSQGER